MKQDTNREYLKKLLLFLETRILSNQDNQWFAKDLYKILAPISDARISDIHEQCIESILREQATEFYKDFVIEDIKAQLITDFIKMEHWRRRNNIQEFCMALYQQLEAITNFICEKREFNLIWRNIRNAGFFTDIKAKDIRVRGNGKSIEQSIVYDSKNYGKELKDLVAMDKYKAILFLVVYKTNVDWNKVSFFNEDFNSGYDIYTMRNLNHRGNILNENKSERIDYILNNPTYAMCSLLGFYARFVYGINNGYHISKELIELAENCCKSNTSSTNS